MRVLRRISADDDRNSVWIGVLADSVRGRMVRQFAGAVGALLLSGTLVAGAGRAAPPPTRYYVSLGDSLAIGIQPDAAGRNHATGQGYVDVVGAYVRRFAPGLRLVKLGGGGSSASLIAGRPFAPQYGAGSQLGQAEAFLGAHRSETILVTVNIGDNDVEHCITARRIDYRCVTQGMSMIARNLVAIGNRLRAAAGPRVTIVGVASYDQFWAFWLNGVRGRRIARASADIVAQVNRTEDEAWRQSGVFVADSGPSFRTLDQRRVSLRGHGRVPRAVERVCHLTWACSGSPVNFNDHANQRGYRVIGTSVVRVIRRAGLVP